MAEAVEHSDLEGAANKVTEITVSCQTEFKKYAYNKSEDIWALVTLKAPVHEDENQRAPIDVVAVIDKSGSMAGHKINLVKQTLEFVLSQLKDEDRLSVVTYDTHVYLDFGLTKMTKSNKLSCAKKIQEIRDGSSTNLSGGLLKGLCQIIDRGTDRNEVASVLLFTDGLANAGITKSAGIVAAMADPKRFDNSPQTSGAQNQAVPKHTKWLRKLTGSGSSKKSDSPTKVKKGGPADASVYAFGFGSDHDPDMLKAISDAGNGMYYYIENEDKIPESFGHCLGGLLSTVGQGIQLDLQTEDGVMIKEVHVNRPYETSQDKKSLHVNMGDLQSEEERDVVLNLTIDSLPIPREETLQPLLSVTANYFNVISSSLCTCVGNLGVLRPAIAENKPEEGSVDVNKQRCRIETTNAIAEAMELADNNNLDDAKVILHDAMRRNTDNVYGEDEYMRNLSSDLAACSDVLKDEQFYVMRGKKLHANMMQQHQQERCSEPDAAARYKSRSKDALAAKFKSMSK